MNHLVLVRASHFLGKVWNLSAPYWRSEEKWRAWLLLIAVLALMLGTVYLDVLFNMWNREFYNALEQKDYAAFTRLLGQFALLAAIFILASIYRVYFTQMLEMRWRAWLTREYVDDWLAKQVYYRLELDQHGADNPDQRIAEDVRSFTVSTLGFTLGFLNALVTLGSFVAILWTVSAPLTFVLGGSEFTIHGYLVWAALIYAIGGSFLAHRFGRPLIGLNFERERVEADFRFSLMRLREHAEGIALYRGEQHERTALLDRFDQIRLNWWDLMRITKRLTGFTAGYAQLAIIFPFLMAAPRYFSGALSLGGLMQITSAFGHVQGALSWFVNNYNGLTNWKASLDRLQTFHAALEGAQAEESQAAGALQMTPDAGRSIRAEELDLVLPNGRVILTGADLTIEPGKRVFISGPSGSGKSMLFRTLAGIWPFGRGRICVPRDAHVLFLPQRPYLPNGTLRDVILYPAKPGSFSDEQVRAVLRDVKLDHVTERLNEWQNWSMQLSGGEQQRLAFARALLHKPSWLFLDEATSALDETTEQHIYELMSQRLASSAIVSIAHRPALARYHTERFKFVLEGAGMRLSPA
jgi:putative ATP-binding cassette transporter